MPEENKPVKNKDQNPNPLPLYTHNVAADRVRLYALVVDCKQTRASRKPANIDEKAPKKFFFTQLKDCVLMRQHDHQRPFALPLSKQLNLPHALLFLSAATKKTATPYLFKSKRIFGNRSVHAARQHLVAETDAHHRHLPSARGQHHAPQPSLQTLHTRQVFMLQRMKGRRKKQERSSLTVVAR